MNTQIPALVFAGLFAIGGVSSATAAQIVDQQTFSNFSNSSSLTMSAPLPSIGQSFTPTLNGINFVRLPVNVYAASTFRIDLYQGNGYSGPLIGSSNTIAPFVSIDNDISFLHDTEFDFASIIPLIIGNVYTFSFTELSGPSAAAGGNYLRVSQSNAPYAGGATYLQYTGPFVFDIAFSEGINTNAIPEPSTLALAGLALVGGVMLRKRQSAPRA